MEQLNLFPEQPSIEERFHRFDAEHPEIYVLFKQLAFDLLHAGRTRYSADGLLHVIRWNYAVNPEKDETFRLNNVFSSRYSRKLIAEHPEFADFFETRRLLRD